MGKIEASRLVRAAGSVLGRRVSTPARCEPVRLRSPSDLVESIRHPCPLHAEKAIPCWVPLAFRQVLKRCHLQNG